MSPGVGRRGPGEGQVQRWGGPGGGAEAVSGAGLSQAELLGHEMLPLGCIEPHHLQLCFLF